MFEQCLPGNTKTILALLEKSEIIQKAYLAGGTALALQLGHRISYDLDFFTKEEFDTEFLLPKLKNISNFKLEKTSWRTILGKFDEVRFSIFYYRKLVSGLDMRHISFIKKYFFNLFFEILVFG